jgi:hypothetical protein
MNDYCQPWSNNDFDSWVIDGTDQKKKQEPNFKLGGKSDEL